MPMRTYFVFRTRSAAAMCNNYDDLKRNCLHSFHSHTQANEYMRNVIKQRRYMTDLELLSYDHETGDIRYASFVI